MSLPEEQEAEAYSEIVTRHGTKVTLDQVLETLRAMGWSPPDPKAKRAVKNKGKPRARLEHCGNCVAMVDADTASSLCRNPTHFCPYKAREASGRGG